jgi:hypothetical protein
MGTELSPKAAEESAPEGFFLLSVPVFLFWLYEDKGGDTGPNVEGETDIPSAGGDIGTVESIALAEFSSALPIFGKSSFR